MSGSIVGFGTCRLTAALRSNRERFGYSLRLPKALGFAHTSAEVIQQIRWHRGEGAIPANLWDYVSLRPFQAEASDVIDADVAAIEVSGIGPVVFDGTVLQINRMSERFKDVPQLWRIWRRYPGRKQRAARLRELEVAPGIQALDAQRRAILRRATMDLGTVESVGHDLRQIVDLLRKPVVVLTLCEAGPGPAAAARARAHAIETIVRACARAGVPVYDPSATMAVLGPEAAFLQNGLDTQHYTPAFAERVGAALVAALWPERREVDDGALAPDVVLARRLRRVTAADDPAQVRTLAEQLIALRGRSQLAWIAKARAESALGLPGHAWESWRSVIRLNPPDAGVRFEAAQAAAAAGEPQAALALIDEGLRAGGQDEDVPHLSVARILLDNGCEERAATHLQQHLAESATSLDDLLRSARIDHFAALACRAAVAEHGIDPVLPALKAFVARGVAAMSAAAEAGDAASESAMLAVVFGVADVDERLRRIVMAHVKGAVTATLSMSRTGRAGAALPRMEQLVRFEALPPALRLLLAGALAAGGDHDTAATQFARLLEQPDDLRERSAAALARQALRTEDWAVAMTYAEVLIGALPVTDRLVQDVRFRLSRRAAQEFRAVQNGGQGVHAVIVAARRLLRFEPAHLQACSALAFADDPAVTPAESQRSLATLLAADPDIVPKLLKAVRNAWRCGDHAKAAAYCVAGRGAASADGAAREQFALWGKRLLGALVRTLRAGRHEGAQERASAIRAARSLDVERRYAVWLARLEAARDPGGAQRGRSTMPPSVAEPVA